MAMIKRPSAEEDIESTGILIHWRYENCTSGMETFSNSSKSWHIYCVLLAFMPKRIGNMHLNACTQVFLVVLFKIAQNRNNSTTYKTVNGKANFVMPIQ